MKSHSLTQRIKSIMNLLQVGFSEVKFVVEHDNSRAIVRWTNGPEPHEIYEAASLIGIGKNEFICFKTETINEEN